MMPDNYFKPHYLSEYWRELRGEAIDDSIICRDRQWVYLMYNTDTGLYKIGISETPRLRAKRISNQSGSKVVLLISLLPMEECDESAKYIETKLHEYFSHKRKLGEWFALDIKDAIAIWHLFWCVIEGEDIQDYVCSYGSCKHKIIKQTLAE